MHLSGLVPKPGYRIGTALLALTMGLGLGVAATVLQTSAASAAELSPTPSSGNWTVDGHGNGHGHGLSQYGARGAAIAGLTYDKILSFYYPNTTLATGSATNIRVQVSATGTYPTVQAEAGLTLTGVSGALPTAGIDQWRLVPITSPVTGFQLQRHISTGWSGYLDIARAKLDFQAADGSVELIRTSGARNYRGVMSAVRSGSSAIVVNTVSLDDYVRGVVPSEMPASWQPAAVQAQAVAARSYGRYYVAHPRDPAYDICDTTSCQVYGGLTAEQAGSNDAVTKTSNKVLEYQGAVIFAEFSASNGGLTSSGNQPYFVTKIDPYDNAASGDPYLNWTRTVRASDVAAYYGLRSVSQIEITGRAGGGEWGGLVTTGIVRGISSSGSVTAVNVTGPGLASAMGLSYSYFHIRPIAATGHLDSIKMTALHSVTLTGWAMDGSDTATSSSVLVTVDSAKQTVVANSPRADVQRALLTASPNHGFSTVATVPGGTHRVCVYALTLSGADQTLLACSTFVVAQNPTGNLEVVTTDGVGHFQLRGWSFDPDNNGGPGRIAAYVDIYGITLNGSVARNDVQRVYGLANNAVGFDVGVWVPAGRHSVCVYAINTAGAGTNQKLQCRTITR